MKNDQPHVHIHYWCVTGTRSIRTATKAIRRARFRIRNAQYDKTFQCDHQSVKVTALSTCSLAN